MKKYFKTYTKKSLALLMTVMMLMSCWVFVAPEHNHASAVSAATITATNNAAINGLVINTDVTTVKGAFESDNDNLSDADYNAVYHNVLYTDGTVKGGKNNATATSDKTQYGKDGTGSNGVTIYWYHPAATLFYDGGSDLPRLGVAMNTVMYYTGLWSRKTVNRSSWLNSGLNGFAFNENWHGSDSRINFQWMWNASEQKDAMSYTYKGTDPYNKQEGNNDDHYYANLLKFTGTMGDNEYYREGTPQFGFYGDNGKNNKEIYATSDKKIAIINYVPLKKALTSAATMLADIKAYPNKYTTDSVAKFAELAKALVAAKPNNYVNSTKNDYKGYAAAAKAAVDAWNAWSGLKLATYTVTFQASNDLFKQETTVTYGSNVSYTCKAIESNASGHYRFEKWYEGDINSTFSTNAAITITNVTDDRTIIAKYGDVENHDSAGSYVRPDSTHHKTTCSVCGYISDAVPCTFSGDYTTNGNTHERTCVCGNKQSHTIKWIDNPDPKYQQQAHDCTHDGIYYKSCETCGMKGTDTFISATATGHNYQLNTGLSEPKTCTKDGIAVYTCINPGCTAEQLSGVYLRNPDGTERTGKYYQEKGHDYVQILDVEHSCNEAGYIEYQCKVCHEKHKVYKENDPAAHTWATKLSPIADTDNHGYMCTVCKKKYDDTRITPHNWTLVSTITAQTCSTDGQGNYKCNDCGATKVDTIKADGTSHVLDNPIQNADGKTHTAHCKECAYSEAAVACTNNGNCVCSVCGGLLAHDFTDNTVKEAALKSAATCTAPAVYYYSCSVCGKVNKDDTKTFTDGAALGHDWTNTKKYKKTDATCEVGTIYYKECSRCNISSETLAPTETWTDDDALGHDFNGPAVEGDGSHSYKCTRCDKKGFNGVVDATESCSYGSYTQVDATNHKRTCSICGHEDVSKHNLSDWTFNGTETAKTHTRSCTDGCGYTETKNCTESTNYHKATCLADAYTEHSCPDCGNGYNETHESTKLAHDYSGEYVYDAATNTHKQRCVNGCNELPAGAGEACTYEYTQISGTNTHKAKCSVCQGEKTLSCNGGSATCIEKATCKDCGSKYGDFAAHTFEGAFVNAGEGKHYRACTTDGCTAHGLDGVVDKTANCHGGTAYCQEKATCADCGTQYGEFNANNHKADSLETKDGLAATCMQPGYTSYKKCKDCDAETGKITLDINPNNHNFGGKAVSNDDQTHKLVCQNKNAEGTAQCSASTNVACHSTDSTIQSPTCLEGGYQINTCDECGYVWNSDDTDPLGHDWGKWTYDEVSGKHIRVCKRDDTHTEEGLCANSAQTVTTVNPTCTVDGYDLHVCNDCGHEWHTNPTDATGHTYTEKIIDDAHIYDGVTESCTSAKHYWFDCKDCEKNAKDETDHDKYPLDGLYYQNGPSKGHKWDGKVATSEYAKIKTEATCTTNAIYYVYCTNCGLSSQNVDPTDENYGITFEAYGSATNHNYIEKVADEFLCSAATCSAQAVYYKSCANCGDKSNDTFKYGEMAAHVFNQKILDTAHRITKATCQTKATYWYDCANCDLSAEIYAKNNTLDDAQIAALKFVGGEVNPDNHTALVDVPVKNPTCLEAGYSAHKKCNDCGTEIGKKVEGYEQLNHSYTGAFKIANVEEDGVVTAYMHQRLCVNGCNEYSEVTACTFSKFKQDEGGTTHSKSCVCGNKITEACVSSGTASCTEVATCVTCGGAMGVAGNHNLPETWTSSGDGKTHYRVCGNEGCNYKETQKCSGGTANTCGGIYCSICNQQYGTGTHHDWTDWVHSVDATCTEKPKQKRTCKREGCLEYEEEEYGKPNGHTWNEGKVTIPATCTTDGVKTFECTVTGCDGTTTLPLASLGHDLTDWKVTTEPTCCSEGERTRHCKNSWETADGKVVSCTEVDTETLPADPKKHVAADEFVLASGTGTCSTGLIYELKCVHCGTVLDTKTETIPHKWKEVTVHNGTCTKNGTIDMRCDNCGATAVFNDKCEGYPNNFEGTVINSVSAALLPSKGGHSWRKTPLEGDKKYTVVDGNIVYIDIDFSCSYTGKGHRVCEACSESESIVIPKAEHVTKTIPASPATCQTPGYQAYEACINCPYTETPVRIPALGHEDNNGNGKCDRCGFEMYETPSGGSSACGCICHNSSFFISKIIYPIVRFFWKLFRMNPDCSCGKRHY